MTRSMACLTSHGALDADPDNMDLERSGRIRRSQIRVEIRSEPDRPNYETQRYVICESLVQHTFYVLTP